MTLVHWVFLAAVSTGPIGTLIAWRRDQVKKRESARRFLP